MTTYNASTMPTGANRFPKSLRAMPIKVVYTLNDNIQQFFLARHTPIAVRLVKKAEPTRRQRQKTAKQLKRGSSASALTPSKTTRSTPTRMSQMGAESKSEVINVDDMAEEHPGEDPEDTEYGFAPLKVCVKAVWAASPDLAYDRSREWSIYCLDPMEQSGSKAAANDSVASKFSGVMTGMGLVSHALMEDDRTLSPVSVTGRVIDDQGGEALEVILQMKSTMSPAALANPYAAWPQHQMMYGYPQHPSFYRAATASMLAAQQRVVPPSIPARSKSSVIPGSTPAPSDAPTPELSAATPYTESSQETISTVRSSSMEPPRKALSKPFTQQPLTRAPPKPKKPPAKPPQPTPADIFVSLATRLNSVDGGSEPPAPDTEEGQLLDCMVAWLKTAAGARIAAEIGMGAPTPASSLSTDGSTPAEAIEIPASPPTAKASPSQGPTVVSSSQYASTSQRASGSQSKPQPIASTSASSQTKSGRVVLGNKPNAVPSKPNRAVSGGKLVAKSMNRFGSGPHGTRKRAIDDEDYGPNKKRQKTGRSVSGASTGPNSQSLPGLANPVAPAETVKGKGVLEFPKTSDILGIKFAPKRAYSTNLDSTGRHVGSTVTKKHVPAPETPRPKRKAAEMHHASGSFTLTSPFVGGEGDSGEDSLFSEAGTPAISGNFSPFRPMGRKNGEERMTDGIRPSSPCERRATSGSIIRMLPEHQSPIRMLGRDPTRTPSPVETHTPQPRWAADLPPSSPPPPSSPIATDMSSTPVEPGDNENEHEHEHNSSSPTEEERRAAREREREEGPNVNESPSKFFARYFDFDAKSDGGDLASSLLAAEAETATEPGTGTVTPSELESEAGEGYGMGVGFNFNLDDLNVENVPGSSNINFGSSSDFGLDDFGWSDGTMGNGQGGGGGDSSDGELDGAGGGGGASSDLDFDVGELWSWMTSTASSSQAVAGDLASSTSQPDGASSEGTAAEEQDPLRSLLGGCVV